MSTQSALLSSILANPDDDTPRLVYADYLDENGRHERAEFIRIQVERERLPSWELRSRQLLHRERVLLARHGRDWYRELGSISGVEWGRFSRGFVTGVRVAGAQQLIKAAAAIRDRAPVSEVEFGEGPLGDGDTSVAFPWLTKIKLTQRRQFAIDAFRAMLDSGIAAALTSLDLDGMGVENAGAEAIAASRNLERLKELSLCNCFVGVAGVRALAEARHLSTLRSLRFSSYGSGYVEDPFVTDDGVSVLAANDSRLKDLETLELGGTNITRTAIHLLLTSPTFAKLRNVVVSYANVEDDLFSVPPGPARWNRLVLDGCELSNGAVERMSRLPQFSEIAQLHARACELDSDRLSILANASFASGLRELNLASNRFGAAGAEELAKGNWEQLHTLNLASNDIGDTGLAHLASAHLPRLTNLMLGGNRITDAGILAMTPAPWNETLRRLLLPENQIGVSGAIALASQPGLRGLTALDLGMSVLENDGVAAIARADWPELTDLTLSHARCGDAAIEQLAAAPWFRNLLILDLSQCELTARAIRALASHAAGLGSLSLNSNPELGPEGVEVLAGRGAFPALRQLGLMNCNLDVPAMAKLADSELMQHIRCFVYYGNETTQELYQKLRARQGGDFGPDWLTEEDIDEVDW
jgi:uncharacterized protein (TIGR02996 family)